MKRSIPALILTFCLLVGAFPLAVSGQIQKTADIGTVNSQTGTSYTFTFPDRGKLVTFSNASAVSVTLPQATAAGSFRSGWTTFVYNLGAGTVTITPTTSTINGSASIALVTGEGATIFSNGTNYLALRTSVAAGGGGTTINSTDTVLPYRSNSTTFADSPLFREDANTIAQRNGTTAQTLNLYKTFTDSSNYERLRFSSSAGSNPFTITSEALGTGSARDITITSGANLNLNSNSTIQIGGSTSQVIPGTTNTVPLGSSTRFWSDIYAVNLNTSTSGGIFFSGASKIVDAGISNGGVIRVRTRFDAGGTTAYEARTPSQITSDQNDYAPGGPSYFQRWSSNASRNITGLNIAQVDGQTHLVVNVGSNDIVLKHESASSTATNRFLCSTGADITLTANQAAEVIYDGSTQRWRAFKRN